MGLGFVLWIWLLWRLFGDIGKKVASNAHQKSLKICQYKIIHKEFRRGNSRYKIFQQRVIVAKV